MCRAILESQVAQKSRQLHLKVAHNSLNAAHDKTQEVTGSP